LKERPSQNHEPLHHLLVYVVSGGISNGELTAIVIAWTYQCNHEGARKLAAEHSHFLDQGDDGSPHREDLEYMVARIVALGRVAHDSVDILVGLP
jgi:hypothetical protein